MDLSLTADQTAMRDEARRFLAERASSEKMRAAIAAGGRDAALWEAISRELGWCGINVPETDGGLGLGAFETVLLLEETGRRLAPVPLWTTTSLATPLLLTLPRGETRDRLLGQIAAGEATVTVALPNLMRLDAWSEPGFAAREAGGGFELSGRRPAVIDLEGADTVLAPARLEDGIAIFALDVPPNRESRPLASIDLTRMAAPLTVDGAAVGRERRLSGEVFDPVSLARVLNRAQLGLAAELVGVAQGALDLTLDYVGGRVQFGRTIASFQVVKHRCAELTVRIGEARSLVYGAAAGLDGVGGESEMEALGALALAKEVSWRAAEEAIQLHGGVGNTWEYDPHLYLRRAQACAQLLGSAADAYAAIAESVLGDAA
jgi:acyl-CoA dehydrogenase